MKLFPPSSNRRNLETSCAYGWQVVQPGKKLIRSACSASNVLPDCWMAPSYKSLPLILMNLPLRKQGKDTILLMMSPTCHRKDYAGSSTRTVMDTACGASCG